MSPFSFLSKDGLQRLIKAARTINKNWQQMHDATILRKMMKIKIFEPAGSWYRQRLFAGLTKTKGWTQELATLALNSSVSCFKHVPAEFIDDEQLLQIFLAHRTSITTFKARLNEDLVRKLVLDHHKIEHISYMPLGWQHYVASEWISEMPDILAQLPESARLWEYCLEAVKRKPKLFLHVPVAYRQALLDSLEKEILDEIATILKDLFAEGQLVTPEQGEWEEGE